MRPQDRPRRPAEPVTIEAARPVRLPVLTQQWRDVIFVHWAADPRVIAPLLPPGVGPDIFGGASYVGLIALRIHRAGAAGLPAVPYLGSFPEANIRLYSVGPDGRRGVVFRSMEASRLVPVVTARVGLRLPYQWASMRAASGGGVVTYTSRRRWPGRRPAVLRLRIHVGERVREPSEFEHFLTARWGLHATWYGGQPVYLRNEHPRWPLYRAELTELAQDLLPGAGLPAPVGEPLSVLYSPGVPVRFGPPELVRR